MILVISGPSGCGKTTLSGLFEVKGFKRIITSTTRPRRLNDIKDQYFFMDKEEWNDDDYICTTVINGNHYGISKDYLDELNKELNYVIVLDEVGTKELKEHYPGWVYAFYLNTLEATCRERMKHRGDADHNIDARAQYDREHNRYNYLIKENDIYDDALFGEMEVTVLMRQIMDWFNKNEEVDEHIDEGEAILGLLHKNKDLS